MTTIPLAFSPGQAQGRNLTTKCKTTPSVIEKLIHCYVSDIGVMTLADFKLKLERE